MDGTPYVIVRAIFFVSPGLQAPETGILTMKREILLCALSSVYKIPGMRRADRRTSSDDNSTQHPQSRRAEPTSTQELRNLLATARSQRDEAKDQVAETAQQLEESQTRYREQQEKLQSALVLYQETQAQASSYLTLYQEQQEKLQSTLVLYQEAQAQASSYLTLYNEEKTRSSELEVKYNEAQQESQNYLALYKQIEQELKFERRSKAGIKSWETRRKRENERLKQEIGEMAFVLRESLTKKDQAIRSLEEAAARMDRIQKLVDSVEDEVASNPVGMLQKFQRIWVVVREILAE